MSRFPVLIASLGLLAGCATQQLVFEKPGMAAADRKRDEGQCLRASVGSDQGAQVLIAYRIDRDAYIRCMEARGYTARRQ